jgi:hypothetical protein
MTWKIRSILLWTIAASCLLVLNSCMKDNCKHTYTTYVPIYKTLTEVRANMKSGAPTELKQTGKLYIYGKYIFLNEPDKGIHIIDNTTPSDPKNISFINIPGNVDLAVKDNVLYADSYGDLVSFDISNPLAVTAKSFLNNVFPDRIRYYYGYNINSSPDSIKVIADWVKKDTTVDCDSYRALYSNYYEMSLADSKGNYASPNLSGGGQGGSMARFTLINDYLYTVSTSTLNAFSLATPQQPAFVKKTQLDNWGVETIFPFKGKLFIGTTTGILIYNVATPSAPQKTGSFLHVRACDPVIADDDYAFVTLRTGTACQGINNQLEILNITDLSSPKLMKAYPLSNPHGLSKDGKTLFVCDGKGGLKVYDASDVWDLKLIKTIDGLETYDVIATDNKALVVAKGGLYQFNYADINNIKLLSKININE